MESERDLADRVERLEAQVRRLEALHEVAEVMLRYGPLLDGDLGADAVLTWDPDGTYELDSAADDGRTVMRGHEEIRELIGTGAQITRNRGGRAHVSSPPLVAVHGDTAAALSYLQLVEPADDGYIIRRQSAHLWTLRRRDGEWKVERRVSGLLDGRDSSRQLIAAALASLANADPDGE